MRNTFWSAGGVLDLMKSKKRKRGFIWFLLLLVSVAFTILWWMAIQFHRDYRNTPSHHLIGNRPSTVASLKEHGYPFSFIVIGDPGCSERSEELIERALKERNSSFIVVLGDFVRKPDLWNHRFFLAEMTTEMKPFCPIFLVPGNHDIDYLSKKIKRRGRRVTPEIYESLYGPRKSDFVFNNCLFIFCDVDWRRPPDYLNYIRNVLSEKSKGRRHIFVFIHYPPGGLADYVADALPTPKEFFSLLEAYNGCTCFFGHHHGYWRGRYKGVNLIISGGGGRLKKSQSEWGQFHHILRVTVDENKVAEEILTIKEGGALEDRFEEWIFMNFFPMIQNKTWILNFIFVLLIITSSFLLFRICVIIQKSSNGNKSDLI